MLQHCQVFMICDKIFMLPSVQIDLPPSMVITNGLPGKYTAVQMHLHWGGWDLEASGAEHTIDGIRYMAEVGLENSCDGRPVIAEFNTLFILKQMILTSKKSRSASRSCCKLTFLLLTLFVLCRV